MSVIGQSDSGATAARSAVLKLGPVVYTRGAERPIASWTDDTVAVAISVVGVVAMYWDSWRHNEAVILDDNFWSPPHIALYVSLTVLAVWMGTIVLRHQPRAAAIDLAAIPRGYGMGLVGIVVATVGGVGDFVWHAAFGFEDQLNAWWSPPHQLLFYGGTMLAAAPFVSSWHRTKGTLSVRAALPVVLSVAVTMGAATFAMTHLWPLWNNVGPTPAFHDDIARFHDAYPPGDDLPAGQVGADVAVRTFGDDTFPYYYYGLNHSVAGLLLMSLVLTAAVLLVVRRWHPPIGSVAVIFAVYGLVYSIPTEFRDLELVAGLAVAGLLIDVVIARLRPELPARPWQFRAVGATVPALSVAAYLIALALGAGLAWEISVWLGVLITSTMLGLGVACLMAPPATGRADADAGAG